MFLSSTKTKLAAGLVKGDLGQMKKLLESQRGGRRTLPGNPKAGDQGPWRFQRQGHRKCGARAKEYAESSFIADIQANMRPSGKKLISY